MDPISKALGLSQLNEELIVDGSYMNHDSTIYRNEALERNRTMLTCTVCGTVGNMGNMMRWHFSECKTILRTCKHCDKTIPIVKPYIRYSKMNYCNSNCYHASRVGNQPEHVKRNGGKLDEESKQKIRNSFTDQRKEVYRQLILETKPWEVRWKKDGDVVE